MEPISFLARNAILGDGNLWKHPECVNFKAIWTSTTPELLEVKRSIAPELFQTGVRPATVGKGRFANAKPLYRLASVVHPVFTVYKKKTKIEVLEELSLEDLGLWYLDDGCCVKRKDGGSYRFSLSVGDCAATEKSQRTLERVLLQLVGENFGRVYKNNSRATERNKSWIMTKGAAQQVLVHAKAWGVLPHKFPR